MASSREKPPVAAESVRELAVVLHDLAWLMPRTIDAGEAARLDALPPSELEVMRLLVRRPGLTVNQVARELALQRTNASAAVRTLIGRGLLERTRDVSDGRVARLTPTPRAIENRDRREVAWAQTLAESLGALAPAQAAAVNACAQPLRALADALASGVP